MERAKELFQIIETRCRDEGGYLEAFTADWQPESNEKLSENGVMATRTMNTLLHVMEGYTGLYQAWPDDSVKARLYEILDIFENRIYNKEKQRQEVFFDHEYHTLIDLHSFGHDIETSWLAEKTLEVLNDAEVTARIRPLLLQMADHTYHAAFTGHGFANECERGVVNQKRIWWVQAEALLGFLNAYEKTGEERYKNAVATQWAYIRDKLVDKRPGSEWFWYLHEDGTPGSEKPIVEPRKCPYHNGRMRKVIFLVISLHENWTMMDGEKSYPCQVPCSVYDTLINAGALADPYAGENQWEATAVCDRDFAFEKAFDLSETAKPAERIILRFDGIDTLGKVYLNGTLLGETDNMHRVWEYDVTSLVVPEGNLLRVALASPNRYIADMQSKRPLWGVDSTMAGYPHLRKAHYMFGWDWGPQLPDLGIWRGVHLLCFTGGRVRSAYYGQRHENGCVLLSCKADLEAWTPGLTALFRVTAPDGTQMEAPLKDGQAEIKIDSPQLWWVRGLGEQPLYTCETVLFRVGKRVDVFTRRVGLRTLTVSQGKDEWGEEFCFINNGIKVFAMGANYIPEDQILPRATKERTIKLLEDCKAANYNFIRVWGGGIYPDDTFYDWCDENGLIVWQDFMFACSAYRLTPAMEQTVRAEIRDNVLRLRNHASLGLLCGNNEIESAWEGWGLPDDPETKADYLKLFEGIIPEMLGELAPETFYWPSSPSSGGGFRDSSSIQAGDMHYWAVWHNFKPIEAFRQYYYRFCSEYGFESLPDIKTIRSFAEEKDLDLCGHVMEAHQKCTQGNEKVMYYLAQMVNYPYDFERLIYCSQLVQADCIRSNVEHMRRARGRCMGSAYWQVNDSNPVISWSSIDSFGRWKGLHYAARRFYAPVLLSCDDTDPVRPALYVTNDTRKEVRAQLVCRLRDNQACVLLEFTAEVQLPPLTARECVRLDLSADVATMQDKRTKYIEYALLEGEETLSAGTTLFVRPKAFDFIPPQIDCRISEGEGQFVLRFTASCFVKSVCLSLRDHDAVFSDNWFDIHGKHSAHVTLPRHGALAAMSLEDLRSQLMLAHY